MALIIASAYSEYWSTHNETNSRAFNQKQVKTGRNSFVHHRAGGGSSTNNCLQRCRHTLRHKYYI